MAHALIKYTEKFNSNAYEKFERNIMLLFRVLFWQKNNVIAREDCEERTDKVSTIIAKLPSIEITAPVYSSRFCFSTTTLNAKSK